MLRYEDVSRNSPGVLATEEDGLKARSAVVWGV